MNFLLCQFDWKKSNRLIFRIEIENYLFRIFVWFRNFDTNVFIMIRFIAFETFIIKIDIIYFDFNLTI